MSYNYLTVRESTDTHLKLEFNNVDLSIINGLRRIVYAEVNTIAIDSVKMEKNTSPLFDEFICHRLGLLPLKSSTALTSREACVCDTGCDSCQVKFVLDVDAQVDMAVTTRDLRHVSGPRAIMPVELEQSPIIIAQLAAQQSLKLEATAISGNGKKHAKWSPGLVSLFHHHAKINIDRQKADLLTSKEKEAICPTKVYKYNEHTNVLEVEDASRCVYCNECIKKVKSITKEIPISFDFTNTYTLVVETNGALEPRDIVSKALATYSTKIQTFKANVESGALDTEKDTKMVNTSKYKIVDEDHTLGNALRLQLLKSNQVLFAGYKRPHPLDNCIILQLQTVEPKQPTQELLVAVDELLKLVNKMHDNFQRNLMDQ